MSRGGALQRDGMMAWAANGITASSGETAGRTLRRFPMKPLAESKRQHVNHSAPNTIALCMKPNAVEWRVLQWSADTPH